MSSSSLPIIQLIGNVPSSGSAPTINAILSMTNDYAQLVAPTANLLQITGASGSPEDAGTPSLASAAQVGPVIDGGSITSDIVAQNQALLNATVAQVTSEASVLALIASPYSVAGADGTATGFAAPASMTAVPLSSSNTPVGASAQSGTTTILVNDKSTVPTGQTVSDRTMAATNLSGVTETNAAINGSSGITAVNAASNQAIPVVAQAYTGPVAGLQDQYVNITSSNLNITVTTPNWFLHSGNGDDALAVTSGNNVLDGGGGSNFLTGGTGSDTFFVDGRGATADIWSTVVNFHAGDALTMFGVTPTSFTFDFEDGQGAGGYTGLTLHATAPGSPTFSATFAGLTKADLTNGRLSESSGTEADGSTYTYFHANA